MNSHMELFDDIKIEENSMSINEIKTEPQDIKCELKTEADEHIDVKHEIEPISQPLPFIKSISEVEVLEDSFGNCLDDKNSQDAQKNAEKSEANIMPILHNHSKTYKGCLQEEKCDRTADKANTYSVHNNSFVEHNNPSKCTLIEDEHLGKKRFCDKTEHTYSHIANETFTCNFCSQSFSDKLKLKNHKICRYRSEKPLTCTFCNKSFSFNSDLIEHTNIHTNDKPFTCNFCSKSFSRKSSLIHHTNIHTNDKLFTCNFCSKSFSQKSTLIDHTYIHTNDRPFTCHFCGKSFSRKSHLAGHINMHKNKKTFTCNFCNKSFCQKSTLTGHIRTHSNDRPFTCNFCSKSFSRKSHVNQHLRIHTNDKPFTCNVCNKSFSQKSYLVRHTRIHINDKPFT